MNHVMLDLETLGTKADAVILSIGAVKFDLETGKMDDDGFYASVSVDSNLALGRKISENTLIWWMNQSKKAQAVFHEPKQTLETALLSMIEWLGHNKRCIWSNGADFDIPMLAHAYDQLGHEPPWEYWNSRCVRTYKSLPAAASVPKPVNDHNALRDAVNQADYVMRVYAVMTARKVAA
jgi:hypothetical protein